MTVVFISNYYNHHQGPFCQAMYDLLGNDFLFIQTEEMEEERCNMGWQTDDIPTFVKKSYGSSSSEAECRQIIDNADVVIIGSAPNHLVRKRIKDGKIVIRYSERPLKKGLELWKYPYRYLKLHRANPKQGNIYLLCASAYAASDYAEFGLFRNRCYRWGYFPAVKEYSDVNTIIEAKQPASILWVARLIKLKHPELPILVAKKLKDENYSFEVKLIGNGKLENKLHNLIKKLGLEDCVHMLGAMSPEQVRDHMEKSQIFLFTSDKNEGWGAVLNESMNSACGVIASNAIGSVPYLINDGENGMIYPDGNFDDLYRKVKQLLDDPKRTATLGQRAYETMITEWNAEIAAERLLKLLKDLQEYRISRRYPQGPCSKC